MIETRENIVRGGRPATNRRRIPSGRAASAGISLIELLIASVIFSILLLGFTSLFKFSLQAWLKIVGNFNNTQNIGGAMDIISSEFRTAIPPYKTNGQVNMIGYDEIGTPSTTLTNSVQDEIQFHVPTYSSSEGEGGTTAADRDINTGSEIVKRGYWLRRDSTKDSRIQQGRDVATIGTSVNTAYLPTIPAGFSIQDEFAHSLASFDIEYYDGATWVDEWNAQTKGELPQLIRLSMTSIKSGVTTTMAIVVHPRSRGTKITQ